MNFESSCEPSQIREGGGAGNLIPGCNIRQVMKKNKYLKTDEIFEEENLFPSMTMGEKL